VTILIIAEARKDQPFAIALQPVASCHRARVQFSALKDIVEVTVTRCRARDSRCGEHDQTRANRRIFKALFTAEAPNTLLADAVSNDLSRGFDIRIRQITFSQRVKRFPQRAKPSNAD